MVDRNRSLSGMFEYNTQIFDRATIEDLKDNFDLGGHSLLAITLVSALQEEFNKDIKPVSMFEFPTIAELAEFISTGEAT